MILPAKFNSNIFVGLSFSLPTSLLYLVTNNRTANRLDLCAIKTRLIEDVFLGELDSLLRSNFARVYFSKRYDYFNDVLDYGEEEG